MALNTLLFIGKPGSGKGTQTALLTESLGWPTVSSGDLFRALVKGDDHIARRMREEHELGHLAPDWFATYLFEKTILPVSPEEGLIFDGFGRKVAEAKTVIEILTWLGRDFKAVHISVSDEEIHRRLTKRSEVSGRADDSAIEKRLEEYRMYTDPSIQVFKDAGALIEVNGEGEVDAIQAEIRSKLGIK